MSTKTPLEEVAEYVVKNQVTTPSTIQRHLRVGAVKVHQVLAELEQLGVVAPAAGAGTRDVLVPHTGVGAALDKVRRFEAGASA
jgi:DNA segregation ATPase FtsK/SpoIIIE-like protein